MRATGRQRRDAILDAATRVLVEAGCAQLSTRKIAARAGIRSGHLQYYSRTKADVVLAIPRPGRSPLATPVWFDWDGVRFRVQVERGSAKAKALAGDAPVPVALTVQSEVPPYRYAVVHGRARLRPNDQAGLRRRLARRYFGRWVGDLYVASEAERGVDDASLQVLEIEPERTVAHDFRPEAGLVGRPYFALSRWLRPVPA